MAGGAVRLLSARGATRDRASTEQRAVDHPASDAGREGTVSTDAASRSDAQYVDILVILLEDKQLP